MIIIKKKNLSRLSRKSRLTADISSPEDKAAYLRGERAGASANNFSVPSMRRNVKCMCIGSLLGEIIKYERKSTAINKISGAGRDGERGRVETRKSKCRGIIYGIRV